MIWIILFVLTILVSAFLAYRSMKNYQVVPQKNSLSFAFFLIRDGSLLSAEIFQKLAAIAKNLNTQISLERVFKGSDQALILYAPRQIQNNFPELGLIEIEDYLENSKFKIDQNDTFGFLINSKNNSDKLNSNENYLKNLKLEDSNQVCLQVVLKPESNESLLFQSTFRVMVVAKDPNIKVTLLKNIEGQISEYLGLSRGESLSAAALFEGYKKRSLVPKEITNFELSAAEIKALLGL